ncbi:MAG: hypothetical protein AAF441_12650 [Pseudomonadota bacterium]
MRQTVLYSAAPAAAFALAAGVFGVAGYASFSQEIDISPIATEQSPWSPSRPDGFDLTFKAPPISDFNEILQRPVFNKDRKPYKKPPPPPPEPEPVKQEPEPEPESPVKLALDGIVIFAGEKMALIRKEADPDSTPVAEGETFAGWTLVELNGNEAVLKKNGKTRGLTLYPK